MLRSLLALTLVTASPATTLPASQAPVDTIARAKFPTDRGRVIDTLAMLNRAVNDSIQPMSDKEHYGIEELWVMYPPDGKGDCEDYALTKLGILSQADFPIISNTKIVGVLVHGEGHAILAVRLPSGAVAYLDNLNTEPMTRRELVARGYRFFDWRA